MRIVLTGCTKGLGLAMTRKLIALGHWVDGCGRRAEEIERLNQEFNGRGRFQQADVAREDDVERWARAVQEAGQPIDFLINNAGVINRNAALWELTGEEVAKVFEVNVLGTVRVIRHFMPVMLERGKGVIVNFSSGWGRSTSPEVAAYCGSKWAVEGLTQAMSQELPEGMAAVALNPGVINTEMLQSCFGASASSYPDPETWAERAVPYILKLSPKDNGRPAAAP